MATATVTTEKSGQWRAGSGFDRERHLLFAVLSLLAITAAARAGWRPVEVLGGSWPWDGSDVLLYRLIPLMAASLLAWLSFAAFDTRSGVQLVGPMWWRLGWEPVGLFVILASLHIAAPIYLAPEIFNRVAQNSLALFHDDLTGLAWGWLIASTMVGAVTEEIVFRGLLQRALAGYMREWPAVIVQAVVFQLVHVYAYQREFVGLHVFSGLILGFAFMRTRSLATPVLLHVALNLIHFAVFARALD